MSNKLEDFLNDNKDEFDGYEPSEALWNRIEKRIDEPKKNGLLVGMNARKWMYAAAAVAVIAIAAIFVTNQTSKTENTGIAQVEPTQTPSIADVDTTQPQLATTDTEQPKENAPATTIIKKDDPTLASNDNDALKNIADEELVHYTKLVELKQQQITILKKDEPLLYKQFASDFAKIDEEFNELKKQKNSHSNNEQLLEAMIQNLRMQSALLNKQLEIVKTINNNKKKRYEKTYNSTI